MANKLTSSGGYFNKKMLSILNKGTAGSTKSTSKKSTKPKKKG